MSALPGNYSHILDMDCVYIEVACYAHAICMQAIVNDCNGHNVYETNCNRLLWTQS